MRVCRFVKRYTLIFYIQPSSKFCRIFALYLRSLATEGKQEFPPLKKCDVQVLKKMFKGHYTLQL